MIMIFTLCLCLSRSVLFLLSLFPLSFFLLIVPQLRRGRAVCHYDTIMASHPQSLSPFLLLPRTGSVCLLSPDTFVVRKNAALSFYQTFLQTLSLCLALYFMLLQPIQPSHIGSFSLFPLLSSFTLAYNVEIRLSVPFNYSERLHCFGLSFAVSFLCYIGRYAAFCNADLTTRSHLG